MQVALTGATGFIGRYIANHLADEGHSLRCWYRASSIREGFDEISNLQWVEGDLGDRDSTAALVDGCDAVVHAALYRPGTGFRGAEGDLVEFARKNVLGTLELIEAARRANVGRFVFISTCAVHEKILDDRPLDEAHPLWATSQVVGEPMQPKHQIVTDKIRALGMEFGGDELLKRTVAELVEDARTTAR